MIRTRILDARVEFFQQPLKKPLQISSGKIVELTEARVSLHAETNGRSAKGRGSIYLSDLWAWPHAALDHAARDAVLRNYCVRIASELPRLCGKLAHPICLGLRLHRALCDEDALLPELARTMCASPFDAAIHDAAGIALERSAFALYDAPVPIPEADHLFAGRSAAAAVRDLLQPPRRKLDAWWLLSRGDSLGDDLAEAIRRHGFRCFKLKILGADNDDDAERTVAVYRALLAHGVTRPVLSVDSNEGNPDADSVLDYLERVRSKDEKAYAALAYLEQPTHRDIRSHRFDWREVGRLKPVMLDEGLTALDLLGEAQAQGWSGLALKTCKGHSFALVAAAWARENGMRLTLQDLTNPGYAGVHAALFAAHVPTMNGLELNVNQYTPAANADWLPRLESLFVPRNGIHEVARPDALGLGSRL